MFRFLLDKRFIQDDDESLRGSLMDDQNSNELVKYTKALLLLQLQGVSKADDPVKPELLLARAGLNARQIAELLGKNSGAVAKAIQRAGKGGA
jgi:DNA-directed RNA polymerase specialized sigma24 family protein